MSWVGIVVLIPDTEAEYRLRNNYAVDISRREKG